MKLFTLFLLLTSFALPTISQGATIITPDSLTTDMYFGNQLIDGLYAQNIYETPGSPPTIFGTSIRSTYPLKQNGSITFNFLAFKDINGIYIWDDATTPENYAGVDGFTLNIYSGVTLLGTESFIAAPIPDNTLDYRNPAYDAATMKIPADSSIPADEAKAKTMIKTIGFSNTYASVDKIVMSWNATQNIAPTSGVMQIREIGFYLDPVPEPSSLGLLGIGGLVFLFRRKYKPSV